MVKHLYPCPKCGSVANKIIRGTGRKCLRCGYIGRGWVPMYHYVRNLMSGTSREYVFGGGYRKGMKRYD